MSIEQLTPWISLVSGVLSIGYLVGDEMRRRPSASDTEREGSMNVSLTAALRKHEIVILTAVTLFSIAGLAHWYLRSTAYFYPVFIWGVTGFVVAATAIAEAVDDE